MLHHCGLLDPDPEESRILRWVRGAMSFDDIPDELKFSVCIWLNMPGVSNRYHQRTLQMGEHRVRHWTKKIPYEALRPSIVENWASATREDCIRLANLRVGHMDMPLICQVQIIQDLKSGMSQGSLGRIYKISGQRIGQWRRHGFAAGQLPSGFDLLTTQSVT